MTKEDQKKENIKNFLMMALAMFNGGLIYNLLLLPLNLVTGGSGGIAMITKYVYDIEPSTMILLISIACLILCYMYLGKKITAVTLAASILYPLFVKLTSPLCGMIHIDYSDPLIIVIFAGVLSGINNGLIYKTGYNAGGLSVISQILNKYYKVSIAKANACISIIIVVTGGMFFGWTNVMYAIILIYIDSVIVNKVLLGISNNKAFYIMTNKDEEVKDYIINTLGHSVTMLDVKGGFLKRKDTVILTVVPTREYYRVTEGIKLIDDKVFFVVTDSYEVKGGM